MKLLLQIILWSHILVIIPQSGMSQVVEPVVNQTYYLIHSSGKVIGENNEGRTVLQALTGGEEQLVQFIADGAGYYSVKLYNQNNYMALSGSWNTYFINDPNVDEAKYAIERLSDAYVILRCKANNLYLGTDNTTAGSSVFSDKNGTDSRHHWYISEEYHEPLVDVIEYNINPNARYDKAFEGWGVSLCWWANMCGRWTDDKIDEIVDWLVSPDGLNYNIFRYNIGGGDDPQNRNCDLHHMASGKGIRAEMEGFKDGTNSPYNWDRDAAQRKIMLKIKERRPDAIFEAFSNSAPYYMTYSGCCSGNFNASDDNLRPEYYEEFAHYLVEVCRHYYDEYGIEFKTLDPFNEPVTNYWSANGGQEGCHFSTAAQIDFLRILHPVLQQSGLNTVISSADETSVAQTVTDFNAYVAAGILDDIDQWNTHTYTANNMARVNLRALSTQYNKTLWMSEVGAGGSGISGNLSLAQKLMNDIHYLRPEAWVDWQYIEEGNDQWCLVMGNFSEQTYQRVKNYYIRQQLSRYIPIGSHFVYVPNDQMLAAFTPTEDSLVVVIMNNSANMVYHKADFSQFTTVGSTITATRTSETENNNQVYDFSLYEKSLSVQIPAYSITTLIIPVETENANNQPREDVEYVIMARSANLSLQPDRGSVLIDHYDYNDSSQIWKFYEGDGGFRVVNQEGDILTDNGGYFATTSQINTDGQLFTFDAIGDGCYKIISNNSGKALDLQGESNAARTSVGLYDYGTSPAAGHRQWILYELPSDTEPQRITQTIELIEGWNLMSLSVETDTMSIAHLFPHASVVKNDTAYYNAETPEFLNSLTHIQAGNGYLVYNTQEESIIVEGNAIENIESISLMDEGWNLIGYPYTEPVSVEGFFGEELQSVQLIKDFEGFWDASDDNSTIEILEPGNAYFVNTSQ